MSSPRTLIAAIALAAATAVVSPLTAQSVRPNTDSLLDRIRVLDSAVIVRGRSVDSIRRSLVRPVPPIAVRRGALEVRTVAAVESRVRVAVDSVAGLIERRGGPELAARVALHAPMVLPDSSRAMFGMVRVLALVSDTARRSAPIARRPIPATATASQIADGLASMVEQFALQGVDSALAAWVMVGRVPLRAASATEAGNTYIELATTASAALRRCRDGDAPSCLDVLGIDSLPGTRLERWYAPDDYRALLGIVAPAREDSVAVTAWLKCRDDRDAAACVTAATALPNNRIPPPLSPAARVMFLHEVLTAGGPAAYGRLVNASGSVRTRLEHASREPLDTTVRRWRDRIERARPDRMRLQPGFVIASLGWTGAFLGLAVVRRRSWA